MKATVGCMVIFNLLIYLLLCGFQWERVQQESKEVVQCP